MMAKPNRISHDAGRAAVSIEPSTGGSNRLPVTAVDDLAVVPEPFSGYERFLWRRELLLITHCGPKRHPAEAGHLLSCNTLACNQHLKALTQPRRSYQVLQLQRDLRLLLRQ